MKPARQISSISAPAERLVKLCLERRLRPEAAAVDHRRGDAGVARVGEAGRIRIVGGDESDLGGIALGCGGSDQRGEIAAAPGDQHAGSSLRLSHRAAGGR